MQKVAILGGGISGLTTAWRLSQVISPRRIILIEAADRLGGWIETTRTDDGAVFEHGPRGVRLAGRGGKSVLCVIEELGLAEAVLPVARINTAAKKRLIYANGGIHPLPSSLAGLFKTPEFLSEPLWKPIFRESTKTRRVGEDETVYDFFREGFGFELAEMLVDPMCRGVYASSPKVLSARACFPALYDHVKARGSLIRGALLNRQSKSDWPSCDLTRRAKAEKWQLQWTLREGLDVLPKRIAKLLRESGAEVRTGTPCTNIKFSNDGHVTLKLKNEETMQVNHVISTIPAKGFGSLLPSEHNKLISLLQHISAVTVGVVSVEYPGHVLPVEGFGYLVPSSQPAKVLGVIFDSLGFPVQDRKDGKLSTRLTVMLGGQWYDSLFGQKDEQYLTSVALQTLREHLNIQVEPIRVITKVQKECIPQYTLGHVKNLENIEGYIKERKLPFTLTGSSYRGVGLVDCIVNSSETALKVANRLNL